MTKYYSGIGSRSTPQRVLDQMSSVAERLARLGYTLRSGGADGADSAFEAGCDIIQGPKEIFLPWKNFNNNKSNLYPPTSEAFKMAARYHPAWSRCSRGARLLHARNCHQVLGQDLKSPCILIVCWHQNKGGTMQAVRIANDHGISVCNLATPSTCDDLEDILKSLALEE